jgi:predicted DNA binding protein
VREVVEAVGEAFPDSELLSKTEHERSVETAQEFRSTLHDRLTDRQRNTLRTAYHGGYFESPRDSTAEELAETLDISSPTLHYHLRAGQSKLLDAFFDEDSEYERPSTTDDRQTKRNE